VRSKSDLLNFLTCSYLGSIVGMTGVVDWVSDGKHVVRLKNGHPLLGEITGSGCMVGTSVATFCGALSMAAKAESEKASSNLLADGDMFIATIAGCARVVFPSYYSNLPPWHHKDLSSRCCL
jgi:thiamine-phosphate diphosphorylase/hydroxyethylthiazole kinase